MNTEQTSKNIFTYNNRKATEYDKQLFSHDLKSGRGLPQGKYLFEDDLLRMKKELKFCNSKE